MIRSKKYSPLLFMIFGIFVGVFGYQEFLSHTLTVSRNIESYQRFEDVLDVLKSLYYDQEKIDTSKMLEHAVKAYVDALDDPYTSYMDPKTNSGFMEDLKGEADFQGIGSVLSKKDDYLLVEQVVKDSPSFKAGIMPLDRIVLINSGETKNMTLDEAVAKIRGPKGTVVSLWIERIKKDQTKELFEKQIVRDKILVPSVETSILTGNKPMGLIEISVIGEETENLLKKDMTTLINKKVQGVIIDLRGNGGGFLPIAVELVSHFIPKNKLVVSSKYKALGSEEYYSKGYKGLRVPLVVLMDGFSASASEIMALALQEQVGAKLVGTKSFGKGSIQSMYDFKDGASLKYTVGKWYSPSGKNIDGTGIVPDVSIEFDADAYKDQGIDNQLEKAKEVLNAMM